MEEDFQQPAVDSRVINHQHHLAIDLVANLAAIEATHRAPTSPHPHVLAAT